MARVPPPANAEDSATRPSRKQCPITRSRAAGGKTLPAVQNVTNKSQSAFCRCGSRRRYRYFGRGIVQEPMLCVTRALARQCQQRRHSVPDLSVTNEHRKAVQPVDPNPTGALERAPPRARAPAPHRGYKVKIPRQGHPVSGDPSTNSGYGFGGVSRSQWSTHFTVLTSTLAFLRPEILMSGRMRSVCDPLATLKVQLKFMDWTPRSLHPV